MELDKWIWVLVLCSLVNIARAGDAPRVKIRTDDREPVETAQFIGGDSRILTLTSRADAFRLWDASTGKVVGETLPFKGYYPVLKVSRDGSRLVILSNGSGFVLWDTATGKPVVAPSSGNAMRCISFSPDGARVAVAGYNKIAQIWNAVNGAVVGEAMVHADGINDLSFSPDGSRIVTASDDGTARIWDAKTGLQVGTEMRVGEKVSSASFSPDGSRIITRAYSERRDYEPSDRDIITVSKTLLWDSLGKPMASFLEQDPMVSGIEFSVDGRWIATSNDTNVVFLSEAATGKRVGKPLRLKDAPGTLVFSRDSLRLLTVGPGNEAQLWDTATARPVGQAMRCNGGDGILHAFSPNGAYLVTGSSNNSAQLWDTATGKPFGPLLIHQDLVSVVFSPDGKRILTTGLDGAARLWDAGTGKPAAEPMHHKVGLVCATLSSDGTRVLTTGNDHSARLWVAASGKPLGAPMTHQTTGSSCCSPDNVAFSGDGTSALTIDGFNIHVWGTTLGASSEVPATR